MTLQKKKIAFQIWPCISFLAPSMSALFTPSWPLLLRPLLHLLGPFYFDPFYTFLAPFTADPSAHSWPSTTALCTPWPLYHGPFYTLAPLSRPLLHLLGHSTMAPFYTFLVPSSTTPSILGLSIVAPFYT